MVSRVDCGAKGCKARFETTAHRLEVPAGWLVRWSRPPGAPVDATGRLVVLCPVHAAPIREQEGG